NTIPADKNQYYKETIENQINNEAQTRHQQQQAQRDHELWVQQDMQKKTWNHLNLYTFPSNIDLSKKNSPQKTLNDKLDNLLKEVKKKHAHVDQETLNNLAPDLDIKATTTPHKEQSHTHSQKEEE
ncbi:MAG: hypothetical protein WBQ73_03200, partial [Candidatus Babeliales bacterium]